MNTGRGALAAVSAFVGMTLVFGALIGVKAQQAAQMPTPQWQIDAGGTLGFETASVKQNTVGGPNRSANIPLGPLDPFNPTGGLFRATNQSLSTYIAFAYKLGTNQLKTAPLNLPKWGSDNHYDIQAHASGNPTEDQFRLMMQKLLSERFQLAVHFESRQVSGFALVLDKEGDLGPAMELSSCDAGPIAQDAAQAESAASSAIYRMDLPQLPCYTFRLLPQRSRYLDRFVGKGISMDQMTEILMNNFSDLDRPLFDDTEIQGTVNFDFEVSRASRPGQADYEPVAGDPSFLEALKEQLGMKLVKRTGTVDVLVIDHIEKPAPD